jgi:hypothetical protein
MPSDRSLLVTGHALPLDAGWIANRADSLSSLQSTHT